MPVRSHTSAAEKRQTEQHLRLRLTFRDEHPLMQRAENGTFLWIPPCSRATSTQSDSSDNRVGHGYIFCGRLQAAPRLGSANVCAQLQSLVLGGHAALRPDRDGLTLEGILVKSSAATRAAVQSEM